MGAEAVSSSVYCYHCRMAHPREDMRQVFTKGNGKRWRCIHSIQAAKADRAKREEFGRKVSEANKEELRAKLRVKGKAAHEEV